MSKEATGQFGAKLGSTSYWNRVNQTAGLHDLMGDKTTYHVTLRTIGSRANNAIEEIYEDLKSQGSKIRFISSWHRNALAKQVEGLYDVCKMAGSFSSHSSDCIHALNLSILSPWHNSFRNSSAIDKAISIIDHQSIYSKSEAIKLDVLELGIAVNADIKDADRKLGKTTVSTAASIGGSWTGAAAGAKVGAMLGALGGPAAPLTIPVLSLVGGIAGSIGGSRLAEYVVDITYTEE